MVSLNTDVEAKQRYMANNLDTKNSFKTICDNFPNEHDIVFSTVSKPHLAASFCLGPINSSKKLQVLK